MLHIDNTGLIVDARIKRAIYTSIEHGDLNAVRGIVVHQTDSSSSASTFSQYQNRGSNGAHFLIDKDGTVYQCASVFKKTHHVGILKSRCIVEQTCSPTEFRTLSKLNIRKLSARELAKTWPHRYPANQDAIGIELVGRFKVPPGRYEPVTAKQNVALKWLIYELALTLGVPMTEVFRHPEVSYKQVSEAETAAW